MKFNNFDIFEKEMSTFWILLSSACRVVSVMDHQHLVSISHTRFTSHNASVSGVEHSLHRIMLLMLMVSLITPGRDCYLMNCVTVAKRVGKYIYSFLNRLITLLFSYSLAYI